MRGGRQLRVDHLNHRHSRQGVVHYLFPMPPRRRLDHAAPALAAATLATSPRPCADGSPAVWRGVRDPMRRAGSARPKDCSGPRVVGSGASVDRVRLLQSTAVCLIGKLALERHTTVFHFGVTDSIHFLSRISIDRLFVQKRLRSFGTYLSEST